MTVIDEPLYLFYRLDFGEILVIVVWSYNLMVYRWGWSYRVYDYL